MRRTAMQVCFSTDFAYAQFLMIEAETVEDLRRTVNDMNTVAIRLRPRCALKPSVCVHCSRIFHLSHIARLCFAY